MQGYCHCADIAATDEISRAQVWQWVHHPKRILDDGREVTLELFRQMMAEEMVKIVQAVGEDRFADEKKMRWPSGCSMKSLPATRWRNF